jgi:hypothetical protein
VADTILRFLEKTAKMEGELHTLEHRTVEIAALAVKTSVTAAMAAAGVNNGKLRGVGKKGAKVGVRYDVAGNTALVRATGPFQLIERDTKDHRIPKMRGSRAKKRVVVIPGVGVRAWANHPGTKGKHPWEKGVIAAVPVAEKAHGAALYQALEKAYG